MGHMLTGKLVKWGSDRFGYSCIYFGDGNVALIGAYWDDDKGTNSGSCIYLHQTNGSIYTNQLQAMVLRMTFGFGFLYLFLAMVMLH